MDRRNRLGKSKTSGLDSSEFESNEVASFKVSEYDVLCGRGKIPYNHPGNKMFREVIGDRVEGYSNCMFASDRAVVVQSVIDIIASFGGRFLKKNHENDIWTVMSSRECRDKVAHAIRDASKPILEEKKRPKQAVYHSPHEKANSTMTRQQNLAETIQNYQKQNLKVEKQPEVSSKDGITINSHFVELAQTTVQPTNGYLGVPKSAPPTQSESPFRLNRSQTIFESSDTATNFNVSSVEAALMDLPTNVRTTSRYNETRSQGDKSKSISSLPIKEIFQVAASKKNVASQHIVHCEPDQGFLNLANEKLTLPIVDIPHVHERIAQDSSQMPISREVEKFNISDGDHSDDSFVQTIDDALGPLKSDDFQSDLNE